MLWTFVGEDSTSSAQTDTDIAWPTDQTLTFDQAGHPILPQDLKIMWAYALGLTVTRMRFLLPHLLPFGRPAIRPIEQAASPSSRPQFAEFWRKNFTIKASEPVRVQRTNTTAVAEVDLCAVTVGDGNFTVTPGDMYTFRATKTFTPTALTWGASGALAFDDTLEPGRYAIEGFELGMGSGGIARVIFPGPPLAQNGGPMRPGVIGLQNTTGQDTRYFRWGYMGEYGQFESLAPPQLELFWLSATALGDVYMDLVPARLGVRF